MDWPDSSNCADCVGCATSKDRTPREDWDMRRRSGCKSHKHRLARCQESEEQRLPVTSKYSTVCRLYIHPRSNDDCVLHRINTTESAEPNSHVLLAVHYSTYTLVNRKNIDSQTIYCQIPVTIPQWTLKWPEIAWIGSLDRETQKFNKMYLFFTQVYRFFSSCVFQSLLQYCLLIMLHELRTS